MLCGPFGALLVLLHLALPGSLRRPHSHFLLPLASSSLSLLPKQIKSDRLILFGVSLFVREVRELTAAPVLLFFGDERTSIHWLAQMVSGIFSAYLSFCLKVALALY